MFRFTTSSKSALKDASFETLLLLFYAKGFDKSMKELECEWI